MGFLFSNHGKVGSVLNSSGLSMWGSRGSTHQVSNYNSPASSPAKVNGIRDVEVPVSMFLPHEVLHSLATCDCAVLFRSIMFGNRDPREIKKFWDHVRQLAPWKDHPVLQDPSQDFGRLIALQFHADGAEITVMMNISSTASAASLVVVWWPMSFFTAFHWFLWLSVICNKTVSHVLL